MLFFNKIPKWVEPYDPPDKRFWFIKAKPRVGKDFTMTGMALTDWHAGYQESLKFYHNFKHINPNFELPTNNNYSNETMCYYDGDTTIIVDPFCVGFFNEEYDTPFIMPGGKLYITEAQPFFDSTDFQDFRQNFIGYFQKHGHAHIGITVNAHRIDKIAPDIANLVSMWILPVENTIRVTRYNSYITCVCYRNWEDAKKELIPPCEDYNVAIKQIYKQIKHVKKDIRAIKNEISKLKLDKIINLITFATDRYLKTQKINELINNYKLQIENCNKEIEELNNKVYELLNMPYWYKTFKFKGNVFLHYDSEQYYAMYVKDFHKRTFENDNKKDSFYNKDNYEECQEFCEKHKEERPEETRRSYQKAKMKEELKQQAIQKRKLEAYQEDSSQVVTVTRKND